jgi:hypothetical protein
VANVNTYKHSFAGDLCAEVHSPEITAEFGIDLSHNVQIDAIIVAVDSLCRNEL